MGDFYLPGEGPPGRAFGHRQGCLQRQLGSDRKPSFNDEGLCFNSSATFSQWFHDVPGVNKRENFTMDFVVSSVDGSFIYDNSEFFPVDGKGWLEEGFEHNYWFTMEMHTEFLYTGGQSFSFRGDDDVWVFINGTLAMDLGGIHTPLEGSVNLDDLQLVPGQLASLDLFFRRATA